MRIVIAGGGTGGHLFPGIAIAEEFRMRYPDSEVTFIGTEHGIEATIVPMAGYPIRYIDAKGFVGKSLREKISAGIQMVFSVRDARRLLRRLKPDAIIGVGGYASFGPVLAGALLSIPSIIAEQNSMPGFANRVLGKIVDAVCLTYHESISFFPMGKTFVTGNPIRSGIVSGDRNNAYGLFGLDRSKFTVTIVGGSSGARNINNAACGAFPHLHTLREELQFLHQTGKGDSESVRGAYRKWGLKGTTAAFIHQMAEAYAVADLVVARAGATTLAELTAIGKPMILIPYPYAAARHQDLNAMKLSEMGAARVILDHDLNGEILAKHIRELYSDKEMRTEMERASRAIGKPDAAQRVADIVTSILKKNTVYKHRSRAGVAGCRVGANEGSHKNV
jgi:UDP-N-acetylglucosamine--N-acetylmuramyl-(pentapeptide) pyrophosphoryl-undecaprenol N-acetylglucosamine transferase